MGKFRLGRQSRSTREVHEECCAGGDRERSCGAAKLGITYRSGQMYGAPSGPTVARRPQYSDANSSMARSADICWSARLIEGGLLKRSLLMARLTKWLTLWSVCKLSSFH